MPRHNYPSGKSVRQPKKLDKGLFKDLGIQRNSRATNAETRTVATLEPNIFTRNLTGFSKASLDFMMIRGFEGLDERGIIPVSFIGITHSPKATIELSRTTATRTSRGGVVLSSRVPKNRLGEIGVGTDISQPNIPGLSFDAPTSRLHVMVGQETRGDDAEKLSGLLRREGGLVLSGVVFINGHSVDPGRDSAPFMHRLWHK